MSTAARPVKCLTGATASNLPFDELFAGEEPVLLRGAVSEWPLVRMSDAGSATVADRLKDLAADHPLAAFAAPPDTAGRFHYSPSVDGMNFSVQRMTLREFLDQLLAQLDNDDATRLYAGSTDIDAYLPGLRSENDLALDHPDFAHKPSLASIWIGNRTTAPAHFDISNNLACVVAGHRRFTLFPPEQVVNLYPGPLEPTPAGQVVSMVDLHNPDLAKYPRVERALESALVAEMEPGDVLYFPALWWHQVEALDAFNVMINYWWNATPAFCDTPETTLLHAILSLRDRPQREKQAWRTLFDYYIFGDASLPARHLPEHAQGALGTIDDMKARRLRAQILNRINR